MSFDGAGNGLLRPGIGQVMRQWSGHKRCQITLFLLDKCGCTQERERRKRGVGKLPWSMPLIRKNRPFCKRQASLLESKDVLVILERHKALTTSLCSPSLREGYAFNDETRREADRRHPIRRRAPMVRSTLQWHFCTRMVS
jgi:hypothetical protein